MNCRNSGERAKLYASTDAVGRRRTTHLAGVSLAAARVLRVLCHDHLTAMLVSTGIAAGMLPPLCTVPPSPVCVTVGWILTETCYVTWWHSLVIHQRIHMEKHWCFPNSHVCRVEASASHKAQRQYLGDSLLPVKAQDGVHFSPEWGTCCSQQAVFTKIPEFDVFWGL